MGRIVEFLSWLNSEPISAAKAALFAIAIILLIRWLTTALACRFTARMHVEPTISFRNWRVALSLSVAMCLVFTAFSPQIGNLQMPCLGLACCLLGATGILGGADFREYGLMAGGVLIPWSRVRKVEWVDHGKTSRMWIKASWCLPLSVHVSSENKQAVDRLVRSAARYERLPAVYWLSNIFIRAVFAGLIAFAVISAII
ncbi:MAG: hypothetical protein Aurels2KO_44750 [Aureliella sp.]